MIPSAANYNFTTVSPASCVRGGSFYGGTCPRLEELLWLEEAARTAEHRGGYDPILGDYPAIGAKSDPARMSPNQASLSGIQTRLNAVWTTSYHNFYALPSGIWNSPHSATSFPNAVSSVPGSFILSIGELTSAIASAVVTPAALSFTSSMWPKASQAQEYLDAIDKVVRGPLDRSAASVGQNRGLRYFLPRGSKTMYRNGAAGNSPIQDWLAGAAVPNPLFNETSTSSDNTVDYYRVVSDAADYAYSMESSFASMNVGIPRWTYTSVMPNKQTTTRIMFIWDIAIAPLWKWVSSGSTWYERDKTVTRMVWSGSPGGSWFGAYGVCTTSGLSFQFTAGSTASIVRIYGDYITNNVINVSSLASTGPIGTSSTVTPTKVGYVARITCGGAVYVSTTAPRGIGS